MSKSAIGDLFRSAAKGTLLASPFIAITAGFVGSVESVPSTNGLLLRCLGDALLVAPCATLLVCSVSAFYQDASRQRESVRRPSASSSGISLG